MLEIVDLSVSIGGKQVLNGVNLRIGPGETHALLVDKICRAFDRKDYSAQRHCGHPKICC